MSIEKPTAKRPPLSDEALLRFDSLQKGLVPQWKLIGSVNAYEQTMVVVPSTAIGADAPGLLLQAYEERLLCLLLLLKKPRARIVYVTSRPILPSIVDYYLSLLPGIIASQAKKRLFDVTPLDGSPRPLSLKLLERPRAIERLRGLIPSPGQTHLVPYNTSELERELALRLGIPMYGADPTFFPLAAKSGSRRLFEEEGVPHPAGAGGLKSLDEAARAIQTLRLRHPEVRQVFVKLDEGVPGGGRGVVRLDLLAAPGAPEEFSAIQERVRSMSIEASGDGFEAFAAKARQHGCVVEERVLADEILSPSVELRITPLGDVELLSTHDRFAGDPGGPFGAGSTFPADRSYAPAIAREAAKVGKRLAREGVLGRLAVDFLVARSKGEPVRVFAEGINLRKGGTTHPFLTLQFLTDGVYDTGTAVFVTPAGQKKAYLATDHFESPLFRALTPEDLFDIAVRHGLHFNQATQTGVVFHMLSTLSERGRMGLTVIGNSASHVKGLAQRVAEVLESEAREALVDKGPAST